MAERADRRSWTGRRIREHDIDRMNCELSHERVCRAGLPADDTSLVSQLKCGLQDPMNDRFRDQVGYPHHEPQRFPGRAPLQRVLEFLSECEDLVGVSEGDAPAVGQDEVTTAAGEQLLAQNL